MDWPFREKWRRVVLLSSRAAQLGFPVASIPYAAQFGVQNTDVTLRDYIIALAEVNHDALTAYDISPLINLNNASAVRSARVGVHGPQPTAI
jgi:hypothetical protein